MKSIKKILSTTLVATAVISASANLIAADKEWRMATPWSGGPWLERDAQSFADHVNTMSNGDFEIKVFPGGTLGSAFKVTETVKSGVAQLSHNYINYDYGVDPTAALLAGHSSGLTPEEFMLWIYQGGGLELYEAFRLEKSKVVALPCSVLGTEIFLHSNKKVQTFEDFQGLRLRTSGAWAEIASRLGASTVVMAGSEIYSALERGVIDAAEWGSPELNKPTGFQEVAKYVMVPGVHQSGGVLECQVNKRQWDKLTEQEQSVLRNAAKLSVFDSWLASSYADLAAYEELKNGKNEIVKLDPSFITKVLEETVAWEDENAAKNPWFKKVLTSQRKFKAEMTNWSEYRLTIGESEL